MMMRTNVKALVMLLTWTTLLSPAEPRIFGQEPFEAIPKDLVAQYHFDLARYFFPSPEAEKQEREKVYNKVRELERLKGRVGASAADLAQALHLQGEVQSLVSRHTIYLSLR